MWSKITNRKNKSLLWVVSGPSGSGKTTLCGLLLKSDNLNLARSVSFTTRKPRAGEKNYKDYNFIQKSTFLDMIKKGEFLEWQEVFGNFYGTSKKLVLSYLKKNKDVILSIDVKGAMQIKKKFAKEAMFIFVLPKSEKELVRRIIKRAGEAKEEIKKRLKRVREELSFAKKYDYIIVNDKLNQAIRELESIIITKRLENATRAN